MNDEKKKLMSEKYFNNVKIKHLKDFTATTPKGNTIKGIICKKPNRFLGSMLIEEITWAEEGVTFDTEQFIQAMPKIHYYDESHSMYQEEHSVYQVYEKLDGSCLILYGLYKDDKVIEIVPKTRGVPVADSHIVEMYNEVDHANIKAFFGHFKDRNPTLLFELFGVLNQHSIFYPTVRIDIRLIGATEEGSFLNWEELRWLSFQYDFVRPFKIFSLVFNGEFWRIRINPGVFHYYLFEGCNKEEIDVYFQKKYFTQLEVIKALKDMITLINHNYSQKYNRLLLEGCVVDSYNFSGDNIMYLKVKSADIEEKCRTENGIPRKFILKEVHKYFDEYGSQVKDIYIKDENHYKEYVNRNLLEEFDLSLVEMKRTQNRVTNIFLDMLESKEPPKGLQEICNSLVEKYPNTDVSDLMRLFAQEYPEKKRHAGMAYSIFEKIM